MLGMFPMFVLSQHAVLAAVRGGRLVPYLRHGTSLGRVGAAIDHAEPGGVGARGSWSRSRDGAVSPGQSGPASWPWPLKCGTGIDWSCLPWCRRRVLCVIDWSCLPWVQKGQRWNACHPPPPPGGERETLRWRPFPCRNAVALETVAIARSLPFARRNLPTLVSPFVHCGDPPPSTRLGVYEVTVLLLNLFLHPAFQQAAGGAAEGEYIHKRA